MSSLEDIIKILSPDYEFVKRLKSGGFGEVFQFIDRRKISENEQDKEKCKVAIKKIVLQNPQNKWDDDKNIRVAKQILREIKILNNFDQHENIVELRRVLFVKNGDIEEIQQVTNLMEKDLEETIRNYRHKLTDKHTCWIMFQIFSAFKYLHSGKVAHRDMKPNQVLLNKTMDVQICDFGQSRHIQNAESPSHSHIGHIYYRAPEFLLNHQNKYSQKIDIWSIGCIFYELLSGEQFIKTGKTETTAFNSIIEKIGTPPLELLEELNLPIKIDPKNVPFEQKPEKKASQGLKCADGLALDLIDKCLVYDFNKRISAADALKHSYFQEYYEEEFEPDFKGYMDVGFEKDVSQTFIDIKSKIIEEINRVNRKNKEDEYSINLCQPSKGYFKVPEKLPSWKKTRSKSRSRSCDKIL